MWVPNCHLALPPPAAEHRDFSNPSFCQQIAEYVKKSLIWLGCLACFALARLSWSCLAVCLALPCLGRQQASQGNPQRDAARSAAPLCGGGRRPPPLFLATTEVLPCRNRHLVLPQRTSRLPTRETRVLTRAPTIGPGNNRAWTPPHKLHDREQ